MVWLGRGVESILGGGECVQPVLEREIVARIRLAAAAAQHLPWRYFRTARNLR